MDFSQVSKIRLEGKPYDAEVEYLESTGTQWIDTGVIPDAQGSIIMDAQLMSDRGYQTFWSSREVYQYGVRRTVSLIANPNGAGTLRFDYGIEGYSYTMSDAGIRNRREYRQTGNKLYIDNTLKYTVTQSTEFTPGSNVYLLMAISPNNNESYGQPILMADMRVFSVRILDRDGNEIRDFIPVRKNGIGYLFDKVSGQLFGNQGTGAFLYGSDVRCYSVAKIERGGTTLWKKRPYDAEVEYLESTGTQYIDTGLNYFPEYEIGAVVPGAVGNNTLGIGQTWKLGRDKADNPVWRATINNNTYPTSISCGTYADMSYHGTTFRCNSETIVVPANQYVSGTMVLFSTGENIPTAYPLKLYYCRLFDANGVLVRDFIPVRLGQVGYLFDKVSGELFGNAGTGVFGYGADLEG